MKCCNSLHWHSALNAQGSRVIIVVVQVAAVKIYVAAAVEALRKKERQDETQFTTKIDGEFHPQLNANVAFFAGFFLKLTLYMTKLRVLVLCLSYYHG